MSPPQYHPAIIWFYLSLAVISLVAGFAVVRANRFRANNLATGLLLILYGCYCSAYGFIYLNAITAAIYIRIVLALGGQFLPVVWFLRLAICHEGASVRELLHRSRWVWAAGLGFALLVLSPGMIPYESTWDNKMRGPLWVPLLGLVSAAAFALLGRIMLDCRRLKGARLFEAKMVAGGTAVAMTLLSFRGALRAFITDDFSPFTVGIGGLFMLGLVLFGVLSPRLFAARSVFFTLLVWLGAIVGAGLVYTTVLQFGLSLRFPLGITGILAVASGLATWFAVTFVFRKLRWARQNRFAVQVRERILKLGEQGLDPSRMAEALRGILSEAFGAAHSRVYLEREAEPSKRGKRESRGDGAVDDYLRGHQWATRESLERGRQTDAAKEMRRWLDEERGELVVRGLGDLSEQGVLIVLGPRKDETVYSYPEIVSLLELANLVSFVVERVELEGKGRALGKMQAMEMLSATIGHDIKQHLVVMQLLTERVRMPDLDATMRDDFLSRIQTQIEKMNQFSSRLMTLGTAPDVHLAPVGVSQIVDEFERTLGVAAGDAGVRLVIQIDVGLPKILADERALQRALGNLGINAIEAMAEDLESHRKKELKLRVRASRGSVRIELEDTGPGLPSDVQKSLFEPFVPSRKKRGHGLGLYIVWDSIVRMGGRVSHEVPEAGGTRFSVTLPKAS